MNRSGAIAVLLSLCCELAWAGTPAARSDRGVLGDRKDLLQYLNTDLPARNGVMTGSCIVAESPVLDVPVWLYVVLPTPKTRGYLAGLRPDDPPYPPAWDNMGYIDVHKKSVSVWENLGGVATNAIMEGAGWWIVSHGLRRVGSYAQAVSSPPTLKCPSGTTMMNWRYGRRRSRSKGVPRHSGDPPLTAAAHASWR